MFSRITLFSKLFSAHRGAHAVPQDCDGPSPNTARCGRQCEAGHIVAESMALCAAGLGAQDLVTRLSAHRMYGPHTTAFHTTMGETRGGSVIEVLLLDPDLKATA